jgi:hypothetical protein
VGSVTLQPGNQFQMNEWVFANGKLQTVNGSGSFTVGTDCSIQLTFSPSTGGTTAPVPTSFKGLLVNNGSGFVTIQPDTTSTITGTFVAQ